ncbi:hypothetical protein BHE74_00051165 [Ensete ventricosum]|nr:hypothetical protein BHE74_00051165 [Ensete ventricosum]
MGDLPVGPGRVNRPKHPDSWVRAVQLPSLGGSAAVNRPKAWAVAPCSRPSLRVPRCKRLCPRVAAALAGGRLWASSRALAGSLGCSRLPLQPAWPWVDAPARGLAMAGHPCKREIVYPYIPDLVGEDEGSQTSSSLAISIRWISVVNILQSDLATLA